MVSRKIQKQRALIIDRIVQLDKKDYTDAQSYIQTCWQIDDYNVSGMLYEYFDKKVAELKDKALDILLNEETEKYDKALGYVTTALKYYTSRNVFTKGILLPYCAATGSRVAWYTNTIEESDRKFFYETFIEVEPIEKHTKIIIEKNVGKTKQIFSGTKKRLPLLIMTKDHRRKHYRQDRRKSRRLRGLRIFASIMIKRYNNNDGHVKKQRYDKMKYFIFAFLKDSYVAQHLPIKRRSIRQRFLCRVLIVIEMKTRLVYRITKDVPSRFH